MSIFIYLLVTKTMTALNTDAALRQPDLTRQPQWRDDTLYWQQQQNKRRWLQHRLPWRLQTCTSWLRPLQTDTRTWTLDCMRTEGKTALVCGGGRGGWKTKPKCFFKNDIILEVLSKYS